MLTASTGGQVSNKGLQELDRILDVVRDKDVFDQRMAQLKKDTTEWKKAKNELTKARDLTAALAEAQNKKEEADRRLESAKEQARQILLRSDEESKNLRVAAKASRDASLAEAKEAEERLKYAKNEMVVHEKNAKKIMAEAESRLQRAKMVERENLQLNNQIKERIKELKKRLSEF